MLMAVAVSPSYAQSPSGSSSKEQTPVVEAQPADEGEEPAVAPEAPTGQIQPKRMPAANPELGAPRPGRRPEPSAGYQVPRRVPKGGPEPQKVEITPGTAIQPPDWTQPLRDIEADVWEEEFGKEALKLKGNVRLHLDNVSFSADEFSYSKALGEMQALGHVSITQDTGAITADEVRYRVPDPSQMIKPRILEPYMTEQQREKLRLSSGSLDATNVTITQAGQKLHAGRLAYDIQDSTGQLDEASGQAGIYYFGAKRLRIIGPASVDGDDIWVTTCDRDPPHYKIRLKKAMIREGKAVYGAGARLYIMDKEMPAYWPWWGYKPGEAGSPLSFEFDGGHRGVIGAYVNTAMQFAVTPETKLGLRLMPTTKAGVGLGVDAEYDFMKDPASPLFLSKGTLHTLYTTEDRGYTELHHRQELMDNTILLMQVEYWSDQYFYRDFFSFDRFKDRSEPRSFANVTYTQPAYIATATVRPELNDFVHETERLPEGTFHLLQRPLAENLYVSFDTIDGYNQRDQHGPHALRSVNVGRLTYALNLHEGLTLTPFVEVEGTVYSEDADSDGPTARFTETFGTTLQARLHREYPGLGDFSAFKHIVAPSVTYFYQPEPALSTEETPLFDPYDTMNGRSRIEAKLDNVLLARDGKTKDIWQITRVSLFCGNDFWNAVSKSRDYEAQVDVRPRPWYGWLLAAEHHGADAVSGGSSATAQAGNLQLYDSIDTKPFSDDLSRDAQLLQGDYDRVLTYFYYDDTGGNGKFNARMGFAFTETQNAVRERAVLYGMGYKVGEKWGLAFEHWYDFERDELTQQKYQIRRNLHCWEAALTFRDREAGWDFGIEFNLAAFPTGMMKFRR